MERSDFDFQICAQPANRTQHPAYSWRSISAYRSPEFRKQGTPRTLDEISDASGIEKREIGRAYRYVARELGLRILPAKPQDYVPRFAGKLQLSGEVQARARNILKEARKKRPTIRKKTNRPHSRSTLHHSSPRRRKTNTETSSRRSRSNKSHHQKPLQTTRRKTRPRRRTRRKIELEA